MNVNAGSLTVPIDIPWDDVADRRIDAPLTVDSGNISITVPGTPDRVIVRLNLLISIPDTVNRQRPAQIIRIVRSDGMVISAAATGDIRDSADHEQASYNISATDYAPITGASYKVTSLRESTTAGLVEMNIESSQFEVEANFPV